MYSFETLLHASADEIVAIIAATRVGQLADKDIQREKVAQKMGINVTQLVCSFGFNPDAPQLAAVVGALGYASVAALQGQRNYLFIHDRYQGLSVNNILDLYAVMGSHGDRAALWSDLVMSRLTNIEAQLEETINPILIGGYKLEVRAIYERRLASAAFVKSRLQAGYEVLRNISKETAIMLETRAITPEEFVAHADISIDEKCRAVFQGLIGREIVEQYLRHDIPENDRRRLRDALAAGS